MSVQSDDDAYNRGYSFTLNMGTAQAEQYLSAHAADLSATSGEAHWYAVGMLEARSGYPFRVPSTRTAVTPPPPAVTSGTGGTGTYVTPPTPGSVTGGPPVIVRPAPPYQSKGGGVILNPPTTPPFTPPVVVYQASPRFRYLEVCGFLFSKRVPYDAAVKVDRTEIDGGLVVQLLKSWSVSFRLLGDAPGEQREGYHLSGPNGPIARRVAALVNAGVVIPDPRAYGLSDWVAAKTREGVKFLSSAEIDQLGLYSDP